MSTKPFSWVGNNIAGARSKWASVRRWVRIKSPSILSLQETKFQVVGKHNLDGYVTYEHLRTEKTAGGGIYMAISKDLSPALVRDGGVKVEAITVDIFVKKMQISCISAYGPQEKDSIVKKEDFWRYLEEEAIRSDSEVKGFILQGDLNAWLGNSIIKDDPRAQNKNGKFMEEFLKRNELTVVNSLSICKGLITRSRNCKGTLEKSILDFFVVCKKVLALVKSMEIDEEKKNVATNYRAFKHAGRAMDSDHVLIELNLNLNIVPTRPARTVLFNFKNLQGRSLFKKLSQPLLPYEALHPSKVNYIKRCPSSATETH